MKNQKQSIILFLTVILLIPLFAVAQHEGKSRLTGTVTDPEGNPIHGVKVKLFSHKAQSGLEVVTNKKGVFKAMWIRNGKWDINCEKKGYQPQKKIITLPSHSKIVKETLVMIPMQGPDINKEVLKEFKKGNQLFSEGKVDEALAIYEAIIAKSPESHVINLNIGNCHFEKKEYEKAVAAYLKVVEKEPDNVDALISTGNAYSNMKQTARALEWYKKIKVSNINDPVVLYNIGVFYFNSGNIKGAIQLLKRSVEVKADFVDGWYRLGMAYMNEGDNNAAIAALETYLKHDKDSQQAKQVEEILKALKGN